MGKSIANAVLAAIVAVGVLLSTSGCVYVARPGAALAGPAASYYSPQYYDGYVVYYDRAGLPYYYSGGRTNYVPRKYRGYGSLVDHHRVHRPHYDRWHRTRGAKFRSYRHPGHRPPRKVARAARPPRGVAPGSSPGKRGKHGRPSARRQPKRRVRGKRPPRNVAKAAPSQRGGRRGSRPGQPKGKGRGRGKSRSPACAPGQKATRAKPCKRVARRR